MMKHFEDVLFGPWLAALLLLMMMTSGGGCVGPDDSVRQPISGGLKVYCAAVMQPLIGRLAQQYERETGIPVIVQFGGSNTLLSQIRISQTGDLFIAADEHYLQIAGQEGLAGPGKDILEIRPVAVVRRDTEDVPESLQDVCAGDLRLAIGDPDASAIGRSTKAWLLVEDMHTAVERQVHRNGVTFSAVGAIASAVQIRSADLGIVWDLVAESFDLKIAFQAGDHIPSSKIQVAVLACSQQSAKARQFASYVADHFARYPTER